MAQSAGNSTTTYIASIKKFEGNENLEDVIKTSSFIMKSCEEFVAGENISGLTKILNEVPLTPFPSFYLGPLAAKFQLYQKINNDDFHNLILRVLQIPIELADYSKDANLAAFYLPVLKALGDAAIHKKCPLLAIKPLADGIRWWTEGNPRHLTPAHATLLCCCLKARNFRFCMEFLEIDALSLVKEGLAPRKVIPPLISCTTEPVLLYFYYGSLIHAIHENYREALNFLEYLISMRGMSQSAIALEGFKKAILFALILGEKKLTFPGSKVVKYLINHAQSRPYLELACLVTTAPKQIDAVALVVEYLERQKNKTTLNTFQRDQNMGLIEILMEKLRERKVIDLPKTFTAVTRKQAMERTFIQDTQQFDSLVRKLVAQGKLKCTIDHENGILVFPQDDETFEGDQVELDSALLAVSKLTTVVRDATNLLKVAEAGNMKLKKRTVAFGL